MDFTALRMAQTPLKALLGLFLSETDLANNTLLSGPPSETSDLINICQGLKKHDPDEKTLQALARNQILEDFTQEMVVLFTHKAQTVMSLLAEHFDPACASITIGLLRFLSRPCDQLHTVCKHIYPLYNSFALQQSEEELGRFLERLRLLVLNGLELLHLEI